MTNEEKIKAFKRLLKELGIYEAWMRNRKNHCEIIGSKNFYAPISNPCLQDIINSSFAWVLTDCMPLWDLLWREFTGTYIYDIDEMLANEHFVTKMKEKIKEELEKYEQIKKIQR